jgi:hypothetical protein
METDAYLALAHRSLQSSVIEPLRARGIEVRVDPRALGKE